MPNTPHILQGLADNPSLLSEVRSVLERHFEPAKDMDTNVNDAELGQFLRARLTGLKAIDAAFKEINQYKTIPDRPRGENPAR